MKEKFHILDFYSFHMLSYCKGNYNISRDDNTHPKILKNCTKQKGWFYFDPLKALSDNSTFVEEFEALGWPDLIQKIVNSMGAATRVMLVFYCISIVGIFTACLGAWWDAFDRRRRLADIKYMCSAVSTSTIWFVEDLKKTDAHISILRLRC